MRISLDELERTVSKAAVAGGWPLGLAAEAGRGATWLSRRGVDPLGHALSAIASGHRTADPSRIGGIHVFSPARAITDAPAATDLVLAGEGPSLLRAPDSLLFALGIVAALGERAGQRILVGAVGKGGVAAEAAADDLAPQRLAAIDLPGRTRALSIRLPEPRARPRAVPERDGAQVDPSAWAEMAALALRTAVPSDDRSRRFGAGGADDA